MSDEKKIVIVDADLEELIPGFLKNRGNDVNTLKEALKANDIDTVQSTGHSLKGVGGGYGFDTLSDYGARIEAAAKANDTGALPTLVDDLEDYLNNIEVVFE